MRARKDVDVAVVDLDTVLSNSIREGVMNLNIKFEYEYDRTDDASMYMDTYN